MSDIADVSVAASNTAQLTAWDGTRRAVLGGARGRLRRRESPATTSRCSSLRPSAERHASSTSDAAPVRRPATPRGSPPQGQRSESTCPRPCSMWHAREPSRQGCRTCASCRRTPRCTASSRRRSTWPSAAPAPCSSATPRPRYANIAGALRPGGRVAFAVWQARSENEWFTAFTGALSAGRDLPAPPPDAPHPFSMSDPDRVRPAAHRRRLRRHRAQRGAQPDDVRRHGPRGPRLRPRPTGLAGRRPRRDPPDARLYWR